MRQTALHYSLATSRSTEATEALLRWAVDRVVGTSKFQITKPDALFVVFLGITWAYDFVKKKSIMNSWPKNGPE